MMNACAPNEINRAISLARLTFSLYQHACHDSAAMDHFVKTSPFSGPDELHAFMVTAAVLTKSPEDLAKFYNINLTTANSMFDTAAITMASKMYDEAEPSQQQKKDALRSALAAILEKTLANNLAPATEKAAKTDVEEKDDFAKFFHKNINSIINNITACSTPSHAFEINVATGEVERLSKEKYAKAMAMIAEKVKKENASQ